MLLIIFKILKKIIKEYNDITIVHIDPIYDKKFYKTNKIRKLNNAIKFIQKINALKST